MLFKMPKTEYSMLNLVSPRKFIKRMRVIVIDLLVFVFNNNIY